MKQITTFYHAMGEPVVSSLTFWTIYQDLLALFRALPDDPQLAEALCMADEGADEEVPILTGLRELRHGDNIVGENGYVYYGGLEDPPLSDNGGHNGEGVDVENVVDLQEYADFSD